MRILIADDHCIFRTGLKILLTEEYPLAIIDEAVDAESITRKITRAKPDFIICDLSMPGRNGLDTIKCIKRNFPAIPFLVLSMYSEHQFGLRSLRAGAAGYLNKNVSNGELLAALRIIVQGRKYISSEITERLIDELETSDAVKLPHDQLSDKEYEVFITIAAGKITTEIAGEFSLSITTLRNHRMKILRKLNLHTDIEIMRYAHDHSLL